MTTQPSNERPCDPVREAERQAFMEELYRRSGRADKSHPLHARYTGLYREFWESNTDGVAP